MEFNWWSSMLMGIATGASSIMPVSDEAHQRLMLKFMGIREVPAMMELMIHFGIFAALYVCSQNQILKMTRASKLARIPKKKRKRPLDTFSLMDLSLWKTMLLPGLLMLFLLEKANTLVSNAVLVATFLFVNGLILYIPQFLPSSNKDSRSLSRVEGLLMGLGGALYAVPGLSGVGAAVSVASVCGVDRKYGLNMILLMNLGITAGRMILDVVNLMTGGIGLFSFAGLLTGVLACAAAFVAAFFAVRLMRNLSSGSGYAAFAYYSWGLALFTFVLSLMA